MGKLVLGGNAKVRVAAAQVAPVYFDKQRSIDKACSIILEASKEGAQLVVFPETFISGYPAYYNAGFNTPAKEWTLFMKGFQESSLYVDDEELLNLAEAVKQADIYAIIGCNEIDDRPGSLTIYNTLLFFDRSGKLLGRHRKVMPTYMERLFHGFGSGDDIQVFQTDIGRIGGLVCWENHMPLITAITMHQGEELHAAVFPGKTKARSPADMVGEDEQLIEPAPNQGDASQHFAACREYAFQAGAFVIGVSGILRSENIGEQFGFLKKNPRMTYNWARGGSVIVAPSNAYVVEPRYGKEEVIYADCHADQIRMAKVLYDVLGHYQRWDIARIEARKASPESWIIPPKPASIEQLLSTVPRLAEKYDVDEQRVTALLIELFQQWTDAPQIDAHKQEHNSRGQ